MIDEKVAKVLGDTRVSELLACDEQGLKDRIVTAEMQKEEAKRELESNDEYIRIKETKKDMEASLRDLNKELNAVTKACVQILEQRGKNV